mgnify:CR=1 FL=1
MEEERLINPELENSGEERLENSLRPKTLDEYIGQDKIKENMKVYIEAAKKRGEPLDHVLLYGPPGLGKTTLSNIISNEMNSNIKITSGPAIEKPGDLAALLTNLSEFDVLFIDEIHRFNKLQQDALLPFVEKGTVILIGATTENPYFEVNKALISRSMVFKLEPLNEDDIFKVLKSSLVREEGLGQYKIKIEDETLHKIAETANGDVRTALNGLEVAVLTTKIGEDGYITITDQIAKESVQNRKAIFDKKGDSHYDNISAFIKSMRGSDADAAVFYLARALNGGEDPMFLARRIVISAAEDVGMANPNALVIATNAMQAVHMVGMPEARIILSEAAVYVATSKKSNASYLAINKALEDVSTKDTGEIPMYIRNAPIEGMKSEGYGVGYKYPHDYPGHYVEQQYLPDEMVGTKYYIKDENCQ